jgi:hypothetical protein
VLAKLQPLQHGTTAWLTKIPEGSIRSVVREGLNLKKQAWQAAKVRFFIIQIFCGVAVDKCPLQFTNATIVAPFSTVPKL